MRNYLSETEQREDAKKREENKEFDGDDRKIFLMFALINRTKRGGEEERGK